MAAGTRLNEIQYSMLEEQADRMISIFSITYCIGEAHNGIWKQLTSQFLK